MLIMTFMSIKADKVIIIITHHLLCKNRQFLKVFAALYVSWINIQPVKQLCIIRYIVITMLYQGLKPLVLHIAELLLGCHVKTCHKPPFFA